MFLVLFIRHVFTNICSEGPLAVVWSSRVRWSVSSRGTLAKPWAILGRNRPRTHAGLAHGSRLLGCLRARKGRWKDQEKPPKASINGSARWSGRPKLYKHRHQTKRTRRTRRPQRAKGRSRAGKQQIMYQTDKAQAKGAGNGDHTLERRAYTENAKPLNRRRPQTNTQTTQIRPSASEQQTGGGGQKCSDLRLIPSNWP